ncbi:MAG: helix-turn-helix transcriptional regulator [bacterium]
MQNHLIISALLIQVLLFLPAMSKIFFHSDFESGQTVTQEALKPGAKTIELAENFRLEEWPIENGGGLLQSNIAEKSDAFTYKMRRNNQLLGVAGIDRKHPAGCDIRFGGMNEWSSLAPFISAVDKNALWGSYSAQVAIKKDQDQALAAKELPKLDEYWVQFYVKFDSALFSKITQKNRLKFHWAYQHKSNESFIQIQLGKKNKEFVFFFRSQAFTRNNMEYRDTIASTILAVPDDLYCITYHYRQLKTGSEFNCWINGLHQGSFLSGHLQPYYPIEVIWFGFRDNVKVKRGFNGFFYIDEVMVSDEPLRPLPNPPEVLLKENKLYFSLYNDTGIIGIQWQISSNNTWNYPVYESGLENLSVFSPSKPVPWLYLEPGHNYFVRSRARNSSGLWSGWGVPVYFPTPSYTQRDSLSKGINNIGLEIFFSDSLSLKKIGGSVRDRWIILNTKFSSRREFKLQRYAEVWISFAENNLTNPLQRNLFEYTDYNYMIILHLNNSTFSVKNHKTSVHWTSANGKVLNYVNGKDYKADSSQACISFPFKFDSDALLGPWILNAVSYDQNERASKIFRQPFLLSEHAAEIPEKTGFLRLFLLGFALFFAAVAGYFLIRRLKKSEILSKQMIGDDNIKNPAVKQVINYTKENYLDPGLSQEKAAAQLNLTKKYLGRLFKIHMHTTFSNFLNSLRINKAKELLEDSNQSVTNIAYKCGYENLDTFLKVFKRNTGETPKEYRIKNRNTANG